MKDLRKELAMVIALVFGQHQNAGGFWFASDGQAFEKESDCEVHSQTLEDKTFGYIENERTKDGAKEKTETTDQKSPAKAKAKPGKTDQAAPAKTADTPDPNAQQPAAQPNEKKAAQLRYLEVFKKKPSPVWTAEVLNEKIAAKLAEGNK